MNLVGRIEKRIPMQVPVHLVNAKGRRESEKVITENVSPHGARVVTKRAWRPGEASQLAPLTDEFQLTARVVYCHSRDDKSFSVGLEFSEARVQWGERSLTPTSS
jgi:hypothetical protein